jgi:hypothetical protein
MIIEAVAAYLMQAAADGDFRPSRAADPYALCTCPAIDKENLVTFTGIASDAEMILGEDGRSAEPRQATIFRVLKGKGADVPDPVKVWHVTNPAKCGVEFDYGKRYAIVAEKNSNGELETSYCVMPKAAN